jgi:hypothetical protein
LSLVLRKKFAVKKEKTPKTNILIKSSFRTHSHMDDSILKYVAQADEVWHAGDIGDLSYRQLDENKTHRAVYGILMMQKRV